MMYLVLRWRNIRIDVIALDLCDKEICYMCGKEFYIKDARNTIDRRFYISTYDDFYPEGNICDECATNEIGEWWEL